MPDKSLEGLTGSYREMPDGSLQPNYAVEYSFSVGGSPVLIYKDGILRLCPEMFILLKDIELPPQGMNMKIRTPYGPILLKEVKSIKPLE
jgi:hypothetical protein